MAKKQQTIMLSIDKYRESWGKARMMAAVKQIPLTRLVAEALDAYWITQRDTLREFAAEVEAMTDDDYARSV